MIQGTTPAVIAANRFGLGARQGELQAIGANPKSWLLKQIASPPELPKALRGLPGTPAYTKSLEQWVMARRRARQMPESGSVQKAGKDGEGKDGAAMFWEAFADDVLAEIAARGRAQVTSEQPFQERLSLFWANHFAVSADKAQVATSVGAYQREAIRPRILGSFTDMLIAAVRHPAMLRFLDNPRSIGPGSRLATDPPRWLRRRAARADRSLELGINENLAREILELHTLGVDGGYTQEDVIELARALTGWSVETRLLRGGEAIGEYGFVFRADAHEPGSRRLLGKRYAEGGVDQATAMLRDLARHPATARHLATKLARHFVADHPPETLIARLQQVYLDSGGELSVVYHALVEAPEAWSPDATKFKRPEEFLISAMRATALPFPQQYRIWAGALAIMGQRIFAPGTPAGWPDTADAWIGADALWKRVLIAERLASQLPADHDPVELAQVALGSGLSKPTTIAMARAESPHQASALFLGSPEFQWR